MALAQRLELAGDEVGRTIQNQQGIDQFRVIMDSNNNTPADIESNRINGRIILVPTRAVEFIAIDFIITNSGVSFG